MSTSTSTSNCKIKMAANFIYKVNDVLGVGTWGTVYKGRSKDQSDPRYYAIKKINKFKVQSSQKSYSKYEAQVITLKKSTTIPQVIKIVDFFKTKSSYYIITQYLQNSIDLFQYMKKDSKRKFCESEVKVIWWDLFNGISKLHSLGIYHRDLKLQNVLYVPNKCAKIIDFGMATLMSDSSDSFVGSPLFMSPQVIFNQKYSYKCDIWSLGIIFYCMICNFSPYGDTPNIKAIQQRLKIIEKQGIEFPQHTFVSQSCKEVINACLAYNQKDRKQIKEIKKLKFFDKNRKTNQKLVNEFYEPSTTFKT